MDTKNIICNKCRKPVSEDLFKKKGELEFFTCYDCRKKYILEQKDKGLIKCSSCKVVKDKKDFVKNNKVMISCFSCRLAYMSKKGQ